MAVDIDFVKITDKASVEVIKLVTAENNPEIGLRLGVKGGGCSGLSYDLNFTPQENGDTIISHDGFNVFMDAKSMIYLKGMQLDFQDGLPMIAPGPGSFDLQFQDVWPLLLQAMHRPEHEKRQHLPVQIPCLLTTPVYAPLLLHHDSRHLHEM